jgi:hypothetical protein
LVDCGWYFNYLQDSALVSKVVIWENHELISIKELQVPMGWTLMFPIKRLPNKNKGKASKILLSIKGRF